MARVQQLTHTARQQAQQSIARGEDLLHSLWSEKPFSFMQRMSDEMDRQLNQTISGARNRVAPLFGQNTGGGTQWLPQIEVLEKSGQLMIRADLPGLTREDINIEIEKQTLCISGERRIETETPHHTERRYGRFSRSIGLPDGVDPDSIAAKFENGVLEICMPSPKRVPANRRVVIQTGSSGQATDTGTDVRAATTPESGGMEARPYGYGSGNGQRDTP